MSFLKQSSGFSQTLGRLQYLETILAFQCRNFMDFDHVGRFHV